MVRFIDLLLQAFVVLVVLPIGIPSALWTGCLMLDYQEGKQPELPLWCQLQQEAVLNAQLEHRQALLASRYTLVVE